MPRTLAKIMSAVWMGHSCTEKRYGDPYLARFASGDQVIQTIRKMVAIPQETITYKLDPHGEWEPDGVWQHRERSLVLPHTDPSAFIRHPRDRFVVWSVFDEFENPLGMSPLIQAYPWYFIRGRVRKAWAEYCERYGLPLVIAGVKAGLTSDQRSEFAKTVATIQSKFGGVVPLGKDFDSLDKVLRVIEFTHTATDSFQELLRESTTAINRCLMTPAAGVMEGGREQSSNAMTRTLQESFTWVVDWLGEDLEEVLTEQVSAEVTAHNVGAEVRPARWEFNEFRDQDLVQIGTIINLALKAGINVPLQWAHAELEIPEPEDGEEILVPRGNSTDVQVDPDEIDVTDRDVARAKDDPQLQAAIQDLLSAKRTGDPDAVMEFLVGKGKKSGAFARNGWER